MWRDKDKKDGARYMWPRRREALQDDVPKGDFKLTFSSGQIFVGPNREAIRANETFKFVAVQGADKRTGMKIYAKAFPKHAHADLHRARHSMFLAGGEIFVGGQFD